MKSQAQTLTFLFLSSETAVFHPPRQTHKLPAYKQPLQTASGSTTQGGATEGFYGPLKVWLVVF